MQFLEGELWHWSTTAKTTTPTKALAEAIKEGIEVQQDWQP
jgi:hypothetical protein